MRKTDKKNCICQHCSQENRYFDRQFSVYKTNPKLRNISEIKLKVTFSVSDTKFRKPKAIGVSQVEFL